MDFEKLISDFKSGKPIVIFDDPKREGEADIVIHAKFAFSDKIRLLRKDAGGLVCLCTDKKTVDSIGIKFYTEQLRNSPYEGMRNIAVERMPYGDEPSFCTYINSKKVFTGISDDDRSTTVMEFEKTVDSKEMEKFAERFYAPGHIPLLASRGIEKRKGHTEMSIELCKKAKMSPAVVICEMLGDNGKALSFADVVKYCKKKGFTLFTGAELMQEFKK